MILIILALIPFLVDTLIGIIGAKKTFNLNFIRYVIALSSGIIISAAFFELLPEAKLEINTAFIALGFFVFYLIEKMSMLHACGESECEIHELTKLTVIGMATDNIIDGIAIAISFIINPILGILVTIAVISHETPQALSSAAILQRKKSSKKEIIGLLALAGMMYPIGAFLSFFIPEKFHHAMVAFVAGIFLYVGAGDLLMEAHRKFNLKVIISVILGVMFMFTLSQFLH